jgi:hypothetical protein
MLQEKRDERPLPGHQLLALAVDVGFHQGGRRHFRRLQVFKLDLDPAGAAANLLDDRVRKRLTELPEVVEFVLNPGDAIGGGVLPDEFVVGRPAFPGLVEAAHEGRRRPVPTIDHPCLSVNERRVLAGDNAD